ncbi:MAG: tetratricopeptide repeat protein [Chloroflexi bacterium]|nr:tetratricopeptide repeat protein [Chloroflexota bacterium]
MVRQFFTWLGPVRARTFMGLLILTGLGSLISLALASDQDWSVPVQTLMMLTFLGGTGAIVGTKLPRPAQIRLLLTLGPAIGLVALSLLLPKSAFTVILGLAFGWLLAAQLLFRDRVRLEYRTAIKAMRKQDYPEAINVITDLIKTDQKNSEHYRFRAELNRLAGRMGPAIRDYEEVVNLAPESPVGYNGLAEVYLQQGQYEKAKPYGEQAFQREPTYWVAPYNLGMIEDRLGESEKVIEHLSVVLQRGLPDSRHRLLTYVWLARAYHRLGQADEADRALAKIKREVKGLKEWETIFANEQSGVLRKVLETDVQLAKQSYETSEASAAELFGDEAE